MTLDRIASIDDLAALARRRLPKFAFDFLDGGAGDEAGCARNRERLRGILLKPRYGVGVTPDTSAALFGQTYCQPFGIAPVGLGNLAWPGADLALSRLARTHGVPSVVSTVASTSLETMAAANPERTWFQLYVQRNEASNRDLLRRATEAGVQVLVITVDIAASGTRRRDVRNRFIVPFRPDARLVADLLLHPWWSLATWRAGPPNFANLERYVEPSGGSQTLAESINGQIRLDLRWDDIRRLRDQWPGRLVVKGVLSAEDAVAAREAGADGVWVSNHGGRQLDSAPAPIDAVAAIRAAVGPAVPVIMDSGIRSGEDIVKARLMGADFVFTGRCFYYGMAAGGAAGGARAMTLLAEDVNRVLVQIGCPSFAELDRRWLWDAEASSPAAEALTGPGVMS